MEPAPRPSFFHRLHVFFLPHEKNEYRPHVFRLTSVAVLVFGVLLLESAYLTQTKLVFPHTNFLASVLPGALVALTNDDRAADHLGTVSEDPLLEQAAQKAAEDMAAKGYFAHVSPDGKDPWYWLGLVGYSYEYAGENLAVNFTDSTDVENAWMASPTHHANIVKPEYTKVGIGVANGTYQGKDATFVVQFFATPAEAKAAAPAVAAPVPEEVLPAAATTTEASSTELAVATDSIPVASSTNVLGAETGPPIAAAQAAAPSFFAQAAASPTHTMLYILVILAIAVLLLLVLAIVKKVRVQYLEIIGGGLFLLAIIIVAILLNGTIAETLQISQTATSTIAQ